MSDDKHKYERGYHYAREGKRNEGVGMASNSGFGAILPGKTDVDSKEYQEGYRDGKEDRERNKK